MNQPISSLMERQVSTVNMDATVAEVERQLTSRRLLWAPVLEPGGVVVGVISASDLLQFHAQGRDPSALRAWQLCSYMPISVDQSTSVSEVARQMVEQRVHHVVVNHHGAMVGVVSSLDFVRTFIDTD
jgi:predicted transcriptional regulator